MDKLKSEQMERDREINVARQNNAIREPDRLSGEKVIARGTIHTPNGELPSNEQILRAENYALRLKLVDTMRENERLRDALELIAENYDGHQTFSGTDCQDIAKKALSNKDSDNG